MTAAQMWLPAPSNLTVVSAGNGGTFLNSTHRLPLHIALSRRDRASFTFVTRNLPLPTLANEHWFVSAGRLVKPRANPSLPTPRASCAPRCDVEEAPVRRTRGAGEGPADFESNRADTSVHRRLSFDPVGGATRSRCRLDCGSRLGPRCLKAPRHDDNLSPAVAAPPSTKTTAVDASLKPTKPGGTLESTLTNPSHLRARPRALFTNPVPRSHYAPSPAPASLPPLSPESALAPSLDDVDYIIPPFCAPDFCTRADLRVGHMHVAHTSLSVTRSLSFAQNCVSGACG
ncbi:hypothetical protein C8R46DRAFT_1116149 [Mycena filopes]|nr:hypothetical protein C8R46DRAFT_1116149 [Mycena filopes]